MKIPEYAKKVFIYQLTHIILPFQKENYVHFFAHCAQKKVGKGLERAPFLRQTLFPMWMSVISTFTTSIIIF